MREADIIEKIGPAYCMIHDKGNYPCWQPAFYIAEGIIDRNEIIRAQGCLYPDGTQPIPYELVKCGSCNKTVSPQMLTKQP